MKQLVVLGIFDNDEDRSLEFLRKEEEAIANALDRLSGATEIIYYPHYNLGMEGMIDLITKFRDTMNWFHFSGHHDTDKGIKLNDGNFEQLANLLADCKNLKGVFINGCTSRQALADLEEKIPVCIGTIQPVYDEVAMKFSQLFYQELNTLEKWHDFSEIQNIFHRTNTSTYNLLKEGKLSDAGDRGSESLEKFESNFYFISPITEAKRKEFNRRKPSVHAYKMEEYTRNGGLLSYLEKELGHNPKSYWREPPVMLSNLLKPFLALNVRDEIKGFGKERVTNIMNYFYTYLDLVRFSILSILWEEINQSDLSVSKEEIMELMIPTEEYAERHIDILQELCQVDISKYGKVNEQKVIAPIKECGKLFRKGIRLFEQWNPAREDNDGFFWEAELLLQKLIEQSAFLNSYRIRSVHSKFYMKHRNDLQHKFQIEYILPDGTPVKEDEKNSGYEFANVHSVYLCERVGNKDVVINLSPFYFDNNSYDTHARKIDLYVLSGYDPVERKFEFRPTYDPLKAVQDDSKAIHDRAITDEGFESKNLFNQLDYFMNSLSVSQ